MRYLACLDLDPETGECFEEVWVESPPSAFPELTAAEGAQLGAAIFALWAVAFLFRVLRKEAETS